MHQAIKSLDIDQKKQLLLDNLHGYWLKDIWHPADIPLQKHMSEDDRKVHSCRPIIFNGLPEVIALESKYAAMVKYVSEDYTYKTLFDTVRIFRDFKNVINAYNLNIQSISDLSIERWLELFTGYGEKRKIKTYEAVIQKQINKDYSITEYKAESKSFNRLKSLCKLVVELYDDRDEWEKDVINLRKVGASFPPTNKGDGLIDLKTISQSWLRRAFINLLKVFVATRSSAWCLHLFGTIKHFSNFLANKYGTVSSPEQISRSVIQDFIVYVNSLTLSQSSCKGEKGDKLLAISRRAILWRCRKFIDLCNERQISNFPKKRLFLPHDFPHVPRHTKVEWIEEKVAEQFEKHKDKLPSPHKEILTILMAAGTRPTDTISLPFDCLYYQGDNAIFKRFDVKTQKDVDVPLVHAPDAVSAIKEAQKRAKSLCGEDPKILFPRDGRGRVYGMKAFVQAMRKFILDNDIRGSNGELWGFYSYQCRHTFATDLLNSGAGLREVKEMLGHEGYSSTQKYARVKDQILKEKWAKANGFVDCNGNIVANEQGVDSIDNQYLKFNLLKRVVGNGFCCRGSVKPVCESGNKCIHCGCYKTCELFRPDLEKQLEETENVISSGESQGLTRLVEISRKDANQLKKILRGLDEVKSKGGQDATA